MTPDEHVAAAEELAAAAADLIRITADEALPERMQAAETARAMAAIGRLHVDLSVVRTTRPDPGDWELLATGPALAPVADVTPIRAETDALFPCPECDTLLRRYAFDNGQVREFVSGCLHDCTRRAPAADTAEAPDQQPRKD